MTAGLRRPLLLASLLACALAVLIAVGAGFIAPFDPLAGDLYQRLLPPFWVEGGSFRHVLGTDVLGRDILSRLIYGARVSIVVCAASIGIAGLVGSTLGILAGYLGGWVESIVMRLVDLAVSLPIILIALLIGVLFGASTTNIILIISFVVWSQFARMARGETLRIKEYAFVDLARTAGCSHLTIMLHHILPNIAGSLIVLATLQVGTVIILEASLSFLGVGVPPPTPTWGGMIAEGRSYVISAWWICAFPGVAVVLVVLSVNILGDELTELINPELRKQLGW